MIRFLQTPSTGRKIMFGVIIFAACFAMVITLIPGGILGDSFGFGTNEPGVLAKVGDQQVTIVEAQRAARQMLQQQFGSRGGSSLLPFFVQRAVDQLIMRKAMALEAQRMGLRVSDQEVADWLQHGPFAATLFPGGQFIGQDKYEEFTERNLNLTVPDFEREVQSELLVTKLRTVVEGSITVSDEDLRREYVKRNTKVKFDYAVLSTDDVTKQINPTDSELSAFYQQNQKRYENSNPEKRQFLYVVIEPARLMSRAQVSADDLQSYYNSHQDQFRVPEQVKVSHILISTPLPDASNKPDPKAIEAARAKAADVLQQLKAGADFAATAKKYSEDAATKDQGGDMGWLQRGRTEPEFEKVAFSLAPGQTSEVIQTSLGFNIIKVQDKQAAHVKPLDEVRGQIEPTLAQQKTTALAETLADTVHAESRNAPLATVAAKHGLEVVSSPLLTRADPVAGVARPMELMSSVFAAKEKAPPEMVQLSPGYVVYQLTQIQPPSTPTFEQAKARVEEDFKHERASQLLAQKIQEISDRARASHDLKKAAAEAGASVKTSELVSPDSQVPDIGALTGQAAGIFDLKTGDISEPINTARGGVVVALIEKQDPSPEDFDKKKDELRETLLSQRRNEMLDLFLDGLRTRLEKQGKIHINKQEMDRLNPKSQAG
ncbi:MAG: peptidyl-prolyl cis-trans isomerase [Terriglobales bacterium]|jgi:peptidyl-prolyl cis-trans isomerase D